MGYFNLLVFAVLFLLDPVSVVLKIRNKTHFGGAQKPSSRAQTRNAIVACSFTLFFNELFNQEAFLTLPTRQCRGYCYWVSGLGFSSLDESGSDVEVIEQGDYPFAFAYASWYTASSGPAYQQ